MRTFDTTDPKYTRMNERQRADLKYYSHKKPYRRKPKKANGGFFHLLSRKERKRIQEEEI